MTTMSTRSSRKAIIPMWLVLFGLLALLWSPLTVVTGVVLLTVGVVGSATMLILWKEPALVEVPHCVEASRYV
jgi:predicted RND superfamily exporter protein